MKRVVLQIVALLTLTGLGTAWTYFCHPNRPALYLTEEIPLEGEISLAQAEAFAAATGVIWIDARKRSEFDKGHIPGALLLNEYEYNNLIFPAIQAIGDDLKKQVVVYCDAQKCASSKKIAEELEKSGVDPERVHILHGGWPAWQSAQPKPR